MTEAQVKNAVEKFEALIRAQSDRSDKIKAQGDFIDFKSLDKIIIGVCGGDGIGPVITKESARVLEYLLDDKVKAGKIEFKVIDGLITNFHLPESTLIMLVSAFMGYDNTMNAYKTAVEDKYRFFSFGDAMLIL